MAHIRGWVIDIDASYVSTYFLLFLSEDLLLCLPHQFPRPLGLHSIARVCWLSLRSQLLARGIPLSVCLCVCCNACVSGGGTSYIDVISGGVRTSMGLRRSSGVLYSSGLGLCLWGPIIAFCWVPRVYFSFFRSECRILLGSASWLMDQEYAGSPTVVS